jgi:hypothetical protein
MAGDTYLDENGNPITGAPRSALSAPTYLDDNGEPVGSTPKSGGSTPDAGEDINELATTEGLKKAPFEVLKGAAKGAGHTLTGAAEMARDMGSSAERTLAGPGRAPTINLAERAIPNSSLTRWEQATTPHGDLQEGGFGAEQAAEYLVPGMGEEAAGAKAAEALPGLGRLAKPIGRVAYNAGTQGLMNRVQGGEFGEGAELGAVGGVAGEGARAMAPSIAESALGITKRQRGFGRTPGNAVLEEIPGIRPSTIAENANSTSRGLTADLESKAAKSAGPASTQPAIDLIDKEMAKAAGQNAEGYYNQLATLRNQLTTDFQTKQRLPTQMSPRQILEVKRGVGNLEKGWSPEQKGIARGTVRKVYAALDGELDRTVPGADQLNQRISSLIPVAERADSADRGAAIGQRVGHRLAAHTGALAASVAGGDLGYRHGGTPGAIVGGGLGLMAPEILSSPTAQMALARMMRSPRTGQIARGVTAQFLRRRGDLGEEPDEEGRGTE